MNNLSHRAYQIATKEWAKNKYEHLTLIFYKKKLISKGYNQYKTDLKAIKYYKYPYIHSEFMAINNIPFKYKYYNLNYKKQSKIYLFNFRFNKLGKLLFSKPCINCINYIKENKINSVFYTSEEDIIHYDPKLY